MRFYRATLRQRGTRQGTVSVSVSVRHKSEFFRNGLTNRAVFLARGLPSTYPTLCSNESLVPPKIRVRLLLPSETLSQTSDIENFAAAS